MQAMTDIGAVLTGIYGGATNNAGAPLVIIAAGAGDNTAVTGDGIDISDYKSCKMHLVWLTALADTETLSLAAEYQESDDDSSFDTAVALQASTVVHTASGAGNYFGVTSFDLNFRNQKTFKKYIRFNFTPDLSASATDTAMVMCLVELGGKNVL